MSLKVSRAREQVGQWVVVSVVAAFVASMGMMAYAKYIDDKYGELPGEARPARVQSAEPVPKAAETVSSTDGATTGEAAHAAR